jgi:hypothetical protein
MNKETILMLYSGNYGNLWQLELIFFPVCDFLLWHMRIRMLLNLALDISVAVLDLFTGYKIQEEFSPVSDPLFVLSKTVHQFLLQVTDTK